MATVQLNQDRPLCNARDLTGKRRQLWIVIVQVLRKDDMKVGKNGKRYQAYVLTDMEGTIFGAVSFEPYINRFNRLLEPYNRYYLSNAWVKEALAEYKLSDYAYSWTLNNHTHVDLIEDTIPYTVPCAFNFVKFAQLPKWIDHDQPIDIRCLVVHFIPNVGAAADSKTKHYVVIDEDGIAMDLRVWDDKVDNSQNQVSLKLPEPTIIVVINVKVSTRYGLSLITQTYSCIFYDPPLGIESSLMEWYVKNSKVVAALIKDESFKNTDLLLPFPKADEIIPVIEAIKILEQIKVGWISGNLFLLPAQEKFWYLACPHCCRSFQNIIWESTCNSCFLKGKPVPRCRVDFFLNDPTETMTVSMFGELAEDLIGYSAVEMYASPEKHKFFEKQIEATVYKKPVTCFIKCLDRTFQRSSVRTHAIVKLYSHGESSTVANPAMETMLIESSKTVSTVDTSGSAQLFTPTTKKVLEEISAEAACGETSAMLSPSAKRRLFDAKEDMALVESSVHVVSDEDHSAGLDVDDISQQPLDDGNKAAASTMFGSPVKKTKNKLKEC